MAWTRNAVLIPAFAFLAVGGVLAGTVQDQERRSVWTGVYSTEQAKRAEGSTHRRAPPATGPCSMAAKWRRRSSAVPSTRTGTG